MIPKVINYCWFGGNPLPELAIKCIDSWKKYCPDYEIKEWNESNFDLECCDYIKEAYQAKKWAFVSDYARFDILYKFGGLYFDTDVELIKPIDDLVEKGPFMGLEKGMRSIATGFGLAVNPGLGISANPGLSLYKEILDNYNNEHFINSDGSYDLTTVVIRTTEMLNKHGFAPVAEVQQVAGIYIYPEDYFCPLDYYTDELEISENTRSIHHYFASWLSKEEIKAHDLEKKAMKVVGKIIAHYIGRIYSSPYRIKKKVKQYGLKGSIKFIFKKYKL